MEKGRRGGGGGNFSGGKVVTPTWEPSKNDGLKTEQDPCISFCAERSQSQPTVARLKAKGKFNFPD